MIIRIKKVPNLENGAASYVKMTFEAEKQYTLWIKYSDIPHFIHEWNYAGVDDGFTIRKNVTDLYLYFYITCLVSLYGIDVKHLFEVIELLPDGKVITLNTDRFKPKSFEMPVKSWVEIGKWVHESARKNILNAAKLGLHTQLKPILSRYVGRAYIYQDMGDPLSFYFDGRKTTELPNYIGYNGGIICHNKTQYSVHT